MANISEMERHKLKRLVKELATYRGRHTELVSVYIPSGYDINTISSHISDEQGTASNIKSKQTRENVIGALEKMIQHLKLFKQTPPNGLAVFSGNVSEKDGQEDFKVWSIEPPAPLNLRTYRCDKEFLLEPLKEMLDTDDVYGLVVLDRRDANIALLKGKTITPLQKTHSEVPGKFRAGGQSAPRFQRIRQNSLKDHYKKVADYMKDQFLQLPKLRGIIIGGPSTTVHDFLNKDYLTGDVKQKVIGTKDLSYTGDFGLNELLDKSSDILASEEVSKEKDIMNKFFNYLAKQPEMVTYGTAETLKALKMGAVETLLLSESLEENLIDSFEDEAKQVGTDVRMISTETREGVQLRDLGKVAAILRYPLHD